MIRNVIKRKIIGSFVVLVLSGWMSQSLSQTFDNRTLSPVLTPALRTETLRLPAATLRQPELLNSAKLIQFEDGSFRDRIVVKFKDGTNVRVLQTAASPPVNIRNAPAINPMMATAPTQMLFFDSKKVTQKERLLLNRFKLNDTRVNSDLHIVNKLLQRPSIDKWNKLFSRSESELAEDRRIVETSLQQEFSDLSNYYSIKLKDDSDTLDVLAKLNALDSVELAYLAPIPEDADIPPTTADFSATQGYLNAAPAGIDARFAWTQGGGRGDDIRIIDIEQGWNLDHEDLQGRFFSNGIIKGGNSRQHGTAVLGSMIARNDSSGVVGIVPNARYGVVSAVRERNFLFISWEDYSVAEAINVAASRLRPGDVILIEQHAKGPGDSTGCSCNCGQYRYVAMEYWQAEFDAIRAATARGIIVVEAAGNGGQNLDHSRYSNRFNRATRDSGAILVGAGSSTARSPMCWTNYGSRVDVQGWGENVMTTGYGDIRVNGNDDRQWYTRTFSGTSSASPIVAGAVAAIQGIRKNRGFDPMTPERIRNLLVSTGTAQAASTKAIGPLPNLRNAIAQVPTQDCISFNHNNVTASRINNRWKVVDGSSWLMDFSNSQSEAIKARDIIRHYDLSKMCFIGRPNASMIYFLVNNVAPQGAFPGEDCIAFNQGGLRIVNQGGVWKITDGTSSMLSFGSNRNEANAALATLQRLNVNRQCFVGRPDPGMEYFRR